jgi:3-dehydroquinate dehydratase II
MRLFVVNGPNLDRLGVRETGVYGTMTLSELDEALSRFAEKLGVEVESFQSNHEGELVEVIHRVDADGVIINPGALAHTSHALADAIRSVETPVVEVHISNITEREPWRAVSVTSDACVATIYGRGPGGYQDAIRHLVNRAAMPFEPIRYGPHTDNVGDLRRGDGRGLVVLVHGGVWRHQYRRDITESLAVDLARRGFDTWNIGYRTLGRGGGWPGSGHDVLTAIDFSPQLGGPGGGPLVVVGHSAGGYLGMWAATRSAADVTLGVWLAPVVDLEDAVTSQAELSYESGLLLDAGAPSPADPGVIPTIVVHGEDDDIVPVRHSKGLASARGLDLHLVEGGHFDLLDPTKPHWEWVTERLP